MKNLQKNDTTIGQQKYNLVEKAGESVYIYKDLSISSKDAVAGDICFYDNADDKLILVHYDDWTTDVFSTDRFTPIGVVVVPGIHDVYGTGECSVISLMNMDCNSPDTGSTSAQEMCWGVYGTDISQLDNLNRVCYIGISSTLYEQVQGTTSNAYLPSDRFDTIDNPYDPSTGYYSAVDISHQAPSPYKADSSRNPAYYQTDSPSSTSNCLADFDGVGNTEVLCSLATAQGDWKTAEAITNSYNAGYYPAACCCWRFHPDGTEQGDWYLPAMAELGYMMVRINAINETINTLISAYGSSVSVTLYDNGYYVSSTERDSTTCQSVLVRTGLISEYSGKSTEHYVRAFLRVSA